MWSTGEGNGKPLPYSCLENPMNSMKRQNNRILKEELPRSVGAQYATGDEWKNNSRENEGMEQKQKDTTLEDEPLRSEYATEEERRSITNSSRKNEVKRLGQTGNDTQLWMCLVVKVKFDAVKNNIA